MFFFYLPCQCLECFFCTLTFAGLLDPVPVFGLHPGVFQPTTPLLWFSRSPLLSFLGGVFYKHFFPPPTKFPLFPFQYARLGVLAHVFFFSGPSFFSPPPFLSTRHFFSETSLTTRRPPRSPTPLLVFFTHFVQSQKHPDLRLHFSLITLRVTILLRLFPRFRGPRFFAKTPPFFFPPYWAAILFFLFPIHLLPSWRPVIFSYFLLPFVFFRFLSLVLPSADAHLSRYGLWAIPPHFFTPSPPFKCDPLFSKRPFVLAEESPPLSGATPLHHQPTKMAVLPAFFLCPHSLPKNGPIGYFAGGFC